MAWLAGSIFNIVIGLVFPFAMLIQLFIHDRERIRSFLFGLASTSVALFAVINPISQLLFAGNHWFIALNLSKPLEAMIIVIVFSNTIAAVIQVLTMRIFLKHNNSWKDGAAFGFAGESVVALMMGIAYIQMLVFNNELLSMSSRAEIFAAGTERLFAFLISISISLLLFSGVKLKKPVYYVAAMLQFFTVNIVVRLTVPYGLAAVMILQLMFTIVSVIIIILVKRRYET